LTWDFGHEHRAGDSTWTAQRVVLRPLAPLIWAMATALFVLLPLGLFSRLGDRMLLAALVLLYASLVAALAWLAFMRMRVNLTRWRLAHLGFEALICPPFALNLLRKISAEVRVDEDLVGAARRLLRAEDWQVARTRFLAEVDEELEREEEHPARVAELKGYRQRLLEDTESPR
jgi:hypothetical protein